MSDAGAVKAAIQLREAQARMCQAGHEPSCLAIGLVRVDEGPPWLLIGAGVAAVGLVAWLALR